MTCCRFVSASLALVLVCSLSPSLSAQSAGRRAVRRASGVTGVELGLEGALQAPRGGHLRWLLSAYEVIGLHELRPAPEASITVTTSLNPSEVAAEVSTDGFGRATIGLPIPVDAPPSFRAVLVLRSASEIQRRFELSVRTTEARTMQFYTARPTVRPGGVARVFGRFFHVHTGRPLAQEQVEILLRDSQGRRLTAPRRTTTDPAGLFTDSFSIPTDVEGGLTIEARAGGDDQPVRAQTSIQIQQPETPPLLLALSPETVVAASRQWVTVEVAVRTPNGRPVSEAEVIIEGSDDDDEGARAVTDGRGRARLRWQAPRRTSGYSDAQVRVTARREGLGVARGSVQIRVAASQWAAAVAVEGGALVPSLGGRVWIRAVAIDGRPAPAGTAVRIEGPHLRGGPLAAATDASGVARFDVDLVTTGGQEADRCGGANATALQVHVGPPGPRATSLDVCLPLDPDGAARVRASPALARPGGRLRVNVARSPGARGLPVTVALLGRRGSRLEFIAAQTVSAGDDSVEMELPSDVVGQVVVRARPLHGAERQQVRGGSTSVWVSPGNPLDVQVALNASTDQAQVAFGGTARDDRSVYLLALPIDEAQGLFTRLRQEALGPLGQLRQSPAEATAALVEAALAAEVPRDASAPALLRPGEGLIAVPSPDNPLALGLLRDPWRSRARFVTGRLALIFRAIEDHVAQALPQRIDDVSVRSSNNEWRFNAEIVDAVAQSGGLGSSGATGLGGEPLTIEALQQFDRAFNYNNVARRITRQRLFRIIVALRHFVQRNGFDLPWSRLGDPAEWLRALPGQPVPGSQSLRAEDLVDGWARPFRLQRAAGATRFGLVSPLGGWEVVSAGPDGRVGTADDLWDPTGRVLPSGGGYARAAGEDVLLARLRGVELGRATVEHLRRAGDNLGRSVRSVPPRPEAATEQLTRRLWYRLPSLVEPPLEALALRRPQEPGDGALGRTVTMPVGGGTVAMGLDEEPRTWGLLAYAWSRDGFPALALAATPAAAPLLVEGERPARIVVDQPVFLGLHLTNLTDRDQRVEATVHSSGALRAGSLEPVVLEAQTAGRGYLRLEGQSLGEGSVTVQFSDPSGAPLGRFELNLQVVSGHAPVRLRHGAALTDDRWQTRLPIPADAQAPLAGRVVVLAPRGLVLDPDLMDLRQRDPALIAWAYVLAGHPLDPALQAALLRAQEPSGTVDGSEPILSTACALLPWSAAGTDDEEATAALLRARRALSGISPFIDDNAEVGALRTAAAVLAAVAPGGIPEIAALREGGLDPVARHAARLRTSLRRAIHAYPEEPSLLARAAAALLLADPRDGHGRAMVDRAAAHLEELDGGLRLVPSEERRTLLESLTGTLALAIAAHQVERDELARRLIRGAFHSENVLTRVGGETGFWYLATAAYGALGASLPERVTVTTSGGKREVDLDQGRAVVPLENLRPGRRATVAVDRIGGPILLVRAEAVMGRPFRDRQQGPLQLELHGDVGQTGELAALELTVRADEAVDQPVLDIQLPAGIAVSDPLRESLLNGGQIRDMEPRRPGFLRVWLAPMAAGTTLVLPLPLRWTLSGELRGLGVLAYPRSAPAALTVLAPRDVSLPPSR